MIAIDSSQPRTPAARVAAIFLLLLLGTAVSLLLIGRNLAAFVTLGPWGWQTLLVFAIAVVALAAMPPTAFWIARFLALLRSPTRTARGWSAILAGLFSYAYLFCTAIAQHRARWPYVHDEFSYLIQAHQFAAGHLWMRRHPLGAFFDSFQLFASPVYASAYFPGTALLYVPGIWLHLSAWVTSLIIAGAVAGLLYRITTELIDGVAGWLAVLLLWSDDIFRKLSTMTLAQNPLLLFGLLAILAWLKWRKTYRRRWAIGTGAFLGLAAVTRPVDALCFAVPIVIAMCSDMPPAQHMRDTHATRFVSAICVFAGALPPLILQLMLNLGITGHVTQTPFRMYADRDYPGSSYGFHPYDAAATPVSNLPQKIALFEQYRPLLREHTVANILREQLHATGQLAPPRLAATLMQSSPAPFPLLLPLLPLAWLGMQKSRWVFLAGLPLFIVVYVPYVFFSPHYVLTAGPGLIVAILLGAKQLDSFRWPSALFFPVAMPLLIAGVAIAALPQWFPNASDDLFNAPLIAVANQKLASLPHTPAIVLFEYDPKRNINEEPAYNYDVAWPDDALVIRGHDLGPLDASLFRYYASHQPRRFVYRFDERTLEVTPLGLAVDLATKK